MNTNGIRNALLPSLILVLAAASFGFAQSSLSGHWKLDEKESDNPREKFAEAMRHEDRGPGGGPGRPPGEGGGGFGGRPGGFGNRPGSDEDRSNRMKMMEAPLELTIADQDPEFRIIDNSGVDTTFYTDGRKTEKELEKGRKVVSTAHRDEDSVVVETQAPNGGKITRTYELSPDAQHLFVKLRIPMPMEDQTVTIISVYNKVPEPATQTHPDKRG